MSKWFMADFKGRLGVLNLSAVIDTRYVSVGISGWVCPETGWFSSLWSSSFAIELLFLTLAIHYDPPTKKR
jgi:hypothetical protein